MTALWRTHSACRVETLLDTSSGGNSVLEPSVGRSADAARKSACAT